MEMPMLSLELVTGASCVPDPDVVVVMVCVRSFGQVKSLIREVESSQAF